MSHPDLVKPRFRWLPTPETWKYHVFLGAIAIFVLGPLGGVTATFMNFKIGFFVGGQVLAGILGSAVTFGYGAEGKHGANYMQTLAASVASMAAMAVLIQAMYWLGFPVPDAWKLILYYLCIGMFGVGVGMLYTPLLVDKMQLTYPSGLAVANILRALTDKLLLKASILKLALGSGIGVIGAALANFVPFVGETIQFSGATFGAGMIVGARIGLPAIFIGLIGEFLIPTLRESGWLGDNEPFRKIGFIIALGAILGAALVDITLVLRDFARQMKTRKAVGAPVDTVEQAAFKKVKVGRLVAWVVFWAAATFFVAVQVFDQNPWFVLTALALVFVFMIVNGISMGISDSNPISSAFVLTVLLLALFGLGVATAGLVCASILLIAVSIGGDMQQDRSTGWRLGTSRVKQFRYQVVGVTMGSVLAVGMASFFTTANPELLVDQTEPKTVEIYVADRAAGEIAEVRLAVAAGLELDKWREARGGLSEDERVAREASLNAEKAVVAKAVKDETLSLGELRAYDEARERVGKAVEKWQSAMTYKFVGALSVFMDRPVAADKGVELSTAETTLLRRALRRRWDPNARALVVTAASIAEQRLAADAGMTVEQWKRPEEIAVPNNLSDQEREKFVEEKSVAAKKARAAQVEAADKLARANLLAGRVSASEQAEFEANKAAEAARLKRGAWLPDVPPELANSSKFAPFLEALTENPDAKLPVDLGSAAERKVYGTVLAVSDRQHKKSVQTEALLIGISIGLLTEIIRKWLKKAKRYQAWKTSSKPAAVTEFVLDTTILASPYASSFGGFVELPTSIWFGVGGTYSSVTDWARKKFGRKPTGSHEELPEDMSTNSLVGGGLIAGESLFYLGFGLVLLAGSV